MIIQLGHSRDSDFQSELYDPIRRSRLFREHEWIFPHDGAEVNSRESLKSVDIFIAEVSQPATGIGIELRFANLYGKRIICISRKGVTIGASLKYITDEFIEYENPDELVDKLQFIRM